MEDDQIMYAQKDRKHFLINFFKIATMFLPKVFFDSAPVIVPIVTNIINTSFKTCVFPSDWKFAEIFPILKEGDYEQASNNRQISLAFASFVESVREGFLKPINTLFNIKTKTGNKPKWR
ncbi:Hypothetical predicted protein [Paramuricea clavata]|uniref:Uncharacterized protein n=1 Tax=Paramuricea clavata TaxID=317549 RepID=A0A7D9HYT1_PARCT|nr:Hypothetical predicted protein [Paramuricea clavata]